MLVLDVLKKGVGHLGMLVRLVAKTIDFERCPSLPISVVLSITHSSKGHRTYEPLTDRPALVPR